jgi:D-alanyl-D-alanine dipeptidase
LVIAVLLVVLAGCARRPELIDIQKVSPRIRLDIRYATENNFTKQKLYDEAACLLRQPTAERLSRVQAELETEGMGLKVYDCYRPLAVQRRFWELVPDERFVTNPAGGSNHNRGAAVDLTLVDSRGNELSMPTGFDDFTERAHRSYSGLPEDVMEHRDRLARAMTKQGFLPLPTEWWHFDDPECDRYPVLDKSFSELR